MPWQITQKIYGNDPRFDAMLKIRYSSSFIQFEVHCYYLEGYTWFLHCDRIGVSNVLLGKRADMTETQAKTRAIKYLRMMVKDLDEDLERAGGFSD